MIEIMEGDIVKITVKDENEIPKDFEAVIYKVLE
jgi:hypothetical protein